MHQTPPSPPGSYQTSYAGGWLDRRTTLAYISTLFSSIFSSSMNAIKNTLLKSLCAVRYSSRGWKPRLLQFHLHLTVKHCNASVKKRESVRSARQKGRRVRCSWRRLAAYSENSTLLEGTTSLPLAPPPILFWGIHEWASTFPIKIQRPGQSDSIREHSQILSGKDDLFREEADFSLSSLWPTVIIPVWQVHNEWTMWQQSPSQTIIKAI